MQENNTPIEIDVHEVAGLRQAGHSFLLLDVRQSDEHATASIEGAKLLPMGELPDRLSELEAFRDSPIVVHCHHGGRSLRVTHWLRGQGFVNVRNLTGGIDAWSQEIDPSVPRY
jgi:rhodanese-related sulfurtransferase